MPSKRKRSRSRHSRSPQLFDNEKLPFDADHLTQFQFLLDLRHQDAQTVEQEYVETEQTYSHYLNEVCFYIHSVID